MSSLALALPDGVPLFEVAAPWEVFGVDRTYLADPWYDFTVCGRDPARIDDNFGAPVGRKFDQLAEADTVILPAAASTDQDPPADLIDAVRAAYEAGARVASICTGAFVLAAAGLLDGRRATTHWLHANELARRYPRVTVDPSVLYIHDGPILTSAGKAAGMDLCLYLVREDHGVAIANQLARGLVVPPHRPGGQAQFIKTPLPANPNDTMAELFTWVLARLDQPVTIADMARKANMSTRHLGRVFTAATGTSPLRWLLAQRISRAQELLETTDETVERIAAQTGMGTATSLRRHFHHDVGVPPDAYRRTFRITK